MNFILRQIQQVLTFYQSPQPLNLFLKSHFAQNKQLGSRDRKAISEGVYLYFRLCRFLDGTALDIIKYGIDNNLTQNAYLKKSFEAYTVNCRPVEKASDLPVFSEPISESGFRNSMMDQPRLFIRLKKHGQKNISKLQQHFSNMEVIHLPHLEEPLVSLPNSSKVQDVLREQDYLVQDLSSQQVLVKVKDTLPSDFAPSYIWDVCSGAGGKTIMAKTLWPQSALLATDIRGAILKNLQRRVRQYGLSGVTTQTADMTTSIPAGYSNQSFGLVICDVPCSGSGTWSRTPEQLASFDSQAITDYTGMQYAIVANALELLDEEGYLVYITCSVFKKENEHQVDKLKKAFNLDVIRQELIEGSGSRADAMFYAVMQKKQ